jgi:hypothetical protein
MRRVERKMEGILASWGWGWREEGKKREGEAMKSKGGGQHKEGREGGQEGAGRRQAEILSKEENGVGRGMKWVGERFLLENEVAPVDSAVGRNDIQQVFGSGASNYMGDGKLLLTRWSLREERLANPEEMGWLTDSPSPRQRESFYWIQLIYLPNRKDEGSKMMIPWSWWNEL